MNGLQLTEARRGLRRELRRAASSRLWHETAFVALDTEELLLYVPLSAAAWAGNAVKLVLLAHGCRGYGLSDEESARALGCTAAELAALRSKQLTDTTGIAARIDKEVIERLPETPVRGAYSPEAIAANDDTGRGQDGARAQSPANRGR